MGHKFEFDYAPFDRDEISEMTSEDLQKNILKMKRFIREARTLGKDATKFEVECCYLDHERQMRLRAEKAIRRYRRTGGNK